MRYLVAYSYVARPELAGAPVAAFGNVDITTDGPVNTLAAVRKVEATIGHAERIQQVVLLNLLPLAATEPPPEEVQA